ncbi:Uncharacterized protein OBRU01_17125 [Operophtera brumata]|uniref:Uncharacterized protein n=1 Tax=Operophtera brumata TaxID=104452 RepID=A0A0L7L0U0_OPEBR|nr:Uncharacterized protein OBRU01_17125 [Operophtera brumata]
MARGDECKTASKANYACKSLDVTAPVQKPNTSTASKYQQPKKQEPKNYGSWGPIFKDKKSFTDMHLC